MWKLLVAFGVGRFFRESPACVRSASFLGIHVEQTNHGDCGKSLMDPPRPRLVGSLLQHGFIFLTIFLEMNKTIWNNCTFKDVYGKAGARGGEGYFDVAFVSEEIWWNSLPIFQELVCAEMLIFSAGWACVPSPAWKWSRFDTFFFGPPVRMPFTCSETQLM